MAGVNGSGVDDLRASYWPSGVAGHRVKRALDSAPLWSRLFHTLARAGAETGDSRACPPRCRPGPRGHRLLRRHPHSPARPRRGQPAHPALLVPDPACIEIVPPGVDSRPSLSPGTRQWAAPVPVSATRATTPGSCCSAWGCIQPLEGVDGRLIAGGALAHPDAVQLVVGGASNEGRHGEVRPGAKLVTTDLGTSPTGLLGAAQPTTWRQQRRGVNNGPSLRSIKADVISLVPSQLGVVHGLSSPSRPRRASTPSWRRRWARLRTIVAHGRHRLCRQSATNRDPRCSPTAPRSPDSPVLAAELDRRRARRSQGYTLAHHSPPASGASRTPDPQGPVAWSAAP